MDESHPDDAPVVPRDRERLADEPDLVRRVRSGDAAAFETIFRRYSPVMRDFARRYVVASDDAAEIIQDVFFNVWRDRASWRVRTSLEAYLLGAVRNRALNRLKHERITRRWREREAAPPPPGHLAPPAEAALLEAERHAAIEHALASLPERRRMALLLRWREGMSYAEIAEAMGISVRTVEHTLAGALRDLRDSLAAWRDWRNR